MKPSQLFLVLLCWLIPMRAMADFPIPLPFERLVDESTTIVRCEVIRITPLVPEGDERVSDDITFSYLGPKCFSLVKITEIWKNHPAEGTGNKSAAAVYDSQKFLTIAHGNGSRGIRGLSHDLTEGRSYIVFLRMMEPGMYRFTDCNSVYPIWNGSVPEMGINMNDEDIEKSNPASVEQLRVRVHAQNKSKVSGED